MGLRCCSRRRSIMLLADDYCLIYTVCGEKQRVSERFHNPAQPQPKRSAACLKPQRCGKPKRFEMVRGDWSLPTRCGVGHSALQHSRRATWRHDEPDFLDA